LRVFTSEKDVFFTCCVKSEKKKQIRIWNTCRQGLCWEAIFVRSWRRIGVVSQKSLWQTNNTFTLWQKQFWNAACNVLYNHNFSRLNLSSTKNLGNWTLSFEENQSKHLKGPLQVCLLVCLFVQFLVFAFCDLFFIIFNIFSLYIPYFYVCKPK